MTTSKLERAAIEKGKSLKPGRAVLLFSTMDYWLVRMLSGELRLVDVPGKMTKARIRANAADPEFYRTLS